jgi:hypothetical protein
MEGWCGVYRALHFFCNDMVANYYTQITRKMQSVRSLQVITKSLQSHYKSLQIITMHYETLQSLQVITVITGGGCMPEYIVKELTADIIRNWVSMATGAFSLQDVWRELDILTPRGKNTLRVTMYRLCEEGIVERVNKKDGVYRPVDTELKKIKWQGADPNNTIKIMFPFAIEEYAKIYPKSIIMVAGAKNQGKTSFLYDCIIKNMETHHIDLYNSETGAEQLKTRMEGLLPGISGIDPPLFEAYERYDNFADVIQPDHISVIDYLDMHSDVYVIGEEIDKIFRKLTSGVAIIGIQKPPAQVSIYKGVKKVISRDLGYGGAYSAKRSVLYISLDRNICKLIYVKNSVNGHVNPNNMQWSYGFDKAGRFTNVRRHYEDEEM